MFWSHEGGIIEGMEAIKSRNGCSRGHVWVRFRPEKRSSGDVTGDYWDEQGNLQGENRENTGELQGIYREFQGKTDEKPMQNR